MKPLIVILYDSITNSVFESQVLQPLIKKLARNSTLNIHIISFENNVNITTPVIDGIRFHLFKRYPFIHQILLQREVRVIRSLIKKLNYTRFSILARGPFAGYIAQKTTSNNPILIQARGLVAEEYRYINTRNKKLSFFQQLRYKLFRHIEHIVYNSNQKNITIESVSNALKNYLINAFHAYSAHITIAQDDIPTKISELERNACRTAIRTRLHIKNDQKVYCYNGSCKLWQCPDQTITYFEKEYQQNQTAFLLILTPDVNAFEHALEQTSINKEAYKVMHVKQTALPQYLAAADVGMLFREKDIINTVSRPTKALDYAAAGLHIVHNNTVDYLGNSESEQC